MENESLSQFIARRHRELDDRERPARKIIEDVAAERQQLRRAAMAAGIETIPAPKPEGATQFIPRRIIRVPRRIKDITLKDAVISLLRDHYGGLPALDILAKLNERHGSTYERESLSPQLSRLKQEGHIELTGRVWHLPGEAARAQEYMEFEIEAPDRESLAGERSGDFNNPNTEAQGGKAPPGGGT